MQSQYRAYLLSQRLPAGSPAFQIDESGRPNVNQGEYICRMPTGRTGQLCRLPQVSRQELCRHIKDAHKQELPDRRALGGRSVEGLAVALGECISSFQWAWLIRLGFYRDLMKDIEDQDERPAMTSQAHIRRTVDGSARTRDQLRPPPSMVRVEAFRASRCKSQGGPVPKLSGTPRRCHTTTEHS